MNGITLGLGIYGTVLSTALAVLGYRRERPALKVISRIAWVPTGPNNSLEELAVIRAVNIGHRPIEVRLATFMTDSGEFIYLLGRSDVGDDLPKVLGDGESAQLFFDVAQMLQDGIAPTKAVVIDARERYHIAPAPFQ